MLRKGFFFSETGVMDRRSGQILPITIISHLHKESVSKSIMSWNPGFIFLDQDNFSINALLSKWNLPRRKGVWPNPVFPVEFAPVSFDRQSFMTPNFVADTNLQNQVKTIWVGDGPGSPSRLIADSLQVILKYAKADADKIKSRGGEVIFLRVPSSGPFEESDKKVFPREVYWDRLLAFTGCPGIHFKDYPAIAHFDCPEWSHLTPEQAQSLPGIWSKSFRRTRMEVHQKSI